MTISFHDANQIPKPGNSNRKEILIKDRADLMAELKTLRKQSDLNMRRRVFPEPLLNANAIASYADFSEKSILGALGFFNSKTSADARAINNQVDKNIQGIVAARDQGNWETAVEIHKELTGERGPFLELRSSTLQELKKLFMDQHAKEFTKDVQEIYWGTIRSLYCQALEIREDATNPAWMEWDVEAARTIEDLSELLRMLPADGKLFHEKSESPYPIPDALVRHLNAPHNETGRRYSERLAELMTTTFSCELPLRNLLDDKERESLLAWLTLLQGKVDAAHRDATRELEVHTPQVGELASLGLTNIRTLDQLEEAFTQELAELTSFAERCARRESPEIDSQDPRWMRSLKSQLYACIPQSSTSVMKSLEFSDYTKILYPRNSSSEMNSLEFSDYAKILYEQDRSDAQERARTLISQGSSRAEWQNEQETNDCLNWASTALARLQGVAEYSGSLKPPSEMARFLLLPNDEQNFHRVIELTNTAYPPLSTTTTPTNSISPTMEVSTAYFKDALASLYETLASLPKHPRRHPPKELSTLYEVMQQHRTKTHQDPSGRKDKSDEVTAYNEQNGYYVSWQFDTYCQDVRRSELEDTMKSLEDFESVLPQVYASLNDQGKALDLSAALHLSEIGTCSPPVLVEYICPAIIYQAHMGEFLLAQIPDKEISRTSPLKQKPDGSTGSRHL
ncbi:MAG TPA: hypothetical protein VGZ00_07390 [Candidatus Baltobacteraceae bacterium]|nr:hypothetical protein [Candidatus Baltobacteraceae bacterium]